jgi:hypothetical protein
MMAWHSHWLGRVVGGEHPRLERSPRNGIFRGLQSVQDLIRDMLISHGQVEFIDYN